MSAIVPVPDPGAAHNPVKLTWNPITWLLALMANAPGSIKGLVNLQEIVQALGLSLTAGGLINFAILCLTPIAAHVGTIFPNPIVAGLFGTFLTFLLDLLRRQAHGSDPHAVAIAAIHDQLADIHDAIEIHDEALEVISDHPAFAEAGPTIHPIGPAPVA